MVRIFRKTYDGIETWFRNVNKQRNYTLTQIYNFRFWFQFPKTKARRIIYLDTMFRCAIAENWVEIIQEWEKCRGWDKERETQYENWTETFIAIEAKSMCALGV